MSKATWWEVKDFLVEPIAHTVVKETEKTITTQLTSWAGDLVESKHVKSDRFWPTYAEARAETIRRAEARVKSAQSSLDRAKNELQKARALPEVAP